DAAEMPILVRSLGMLRKQNDAGIVRIGETAHKKEKANHVSMIGPLFNAGNDLRSHTLSRAVPSALRGLTSVFGMGTGGTPAVRSPTNRSRQQSALSIQCL